ncbi:MAG: hypothetical protein QOJ39_1454 [Candidatus Eremiobacteraeota bacterium]|nr:hypothetical protein [Candidatus Eremiobacteraeota bacterium]
MDEKRAHADPGFTLIEIAIVVAIVATTVAAGVGISLASRSFAVSTAAAEFDHLLDSARTIARETQGATLVFAPDAYGDGTEVRVLAPGPNGTLIATTMPIVHTHAAIEEQESLGKAPFAFVIHATGALGGRPGFRLGDTTATGEVGCPASGSFHFVIHTAGTTADRLIPCRINLAATGPITVAPWPPAVIAPPPTPCSAGPCAPAVLPTPPSSTPSCPPNYTATPGGCTPSLPPLPSGPHYHVTATLASATMTVGTNDTITATADLTNASSVPPGTPLTLPVLIQQSTATVCAATPPGPQPSATTFSLEAIAAGTCTITIAAETSNVPAATADTATLSVAVSDSSSNPNPQPPPSCDLNTNGKCYHRIVDPTTHIFEKNVVPDFACGDAGDGPTCWYIDSIKEVVLYHDFWFLPPVAPTTPANELLFQIDEIRGLTYGCEPYSYFAQIPVFSGIPWPSAAVGAPGDPAVGVGEPSIYTRINVVSPGLPSDGVLDDTVNSAKVGATFSDMFASVAFGRIGTAYSFTYSASSAQPDSYITWFPDFPGCDAAGNMSGTGVAYGDVTALIVFEIYQAIPD